MNYSKDPVCISCAIIYSRSVLRLQSSIQKCNQINIPWCFHEVSSLQRLNVSTAASCKTDLEREPKEPQGKTKLWMDQGIQGSTLIFTVQGLRFKRRKPPRKIKFVFFVVFLGFLVVFWPGCCWVGAGLLLLCCCWAAAGLLLGCCWATAGLLLGCSQPANQPTTQSLSQAGPCKEQNYKCNHTACFNSISKI